MNKLPTYEQLQKKVETLENKIDKYEHDFETNQKKIRNLSERVQELNCLYGISSLVEKKENSLTQILNGTVELLCNAWQDPMELMGARIIMKDSEFRTKNFIETPWEQSSDIVVNGEQIGLLQIFLPERKAQNGKQIFIDNVAKRMGRIIEWKKVEALLRGSRGRLYQVIQNMPVMMDAFDSDWNLIAWNKECERVTGYRADEIIGNPEAFELLYPDAAYREEVWEKTINQVDNFYDWEIDLRAKDGTIKTVSWSNISRSCPIPGWTSWAIGRDVTEHKQMRQLQIESERRLIEIINFLPDATFAVNLEGKVIVWNRAIEEMTGVKAEDMLGKGNYEYSLPFYGKRIPILIDLVLKPDSEIEKQYRFFCKKQNTLIAETNEPLVIGNRKIFPWGKASPIFDNNGNICGAIESIRDISARKEAEDHIYALNQRLIKVQESERQQLSFYLHDSVAQNLSSLRIGCETFFDNEPQISAEIKKNVSQWSKTLQETIRVVRDISYDLYPAYLDQLGLIQTIANQCADFFKKTGIKVNFISAGIENLKFNFNTKINLYRVIQEALNNIRKHAEAGHVTIRIVASFPKIILRIEDDGKGFDCEKIPPIALNEKRMGLRSMQERVNLLNGNIRILSDPMKGTKIIIEIPYEDESRDV